MAGWPAFPPAGGTRGVDADVALQFAFYGRDVDVEFVEDAAGTAAGVQREHGEQMLGADLGWGGVGGVGGGVLRGGIQGAGRLGRHRRGVVAGRRGGWSEEVVGGGPDLFGVNAEALQD